jgi:hypothetical protein
MENPELSISKRAQQLRAIYASFAAAIFLYILVLSFNLQGNGQASSDDPMRHAVMLAAVMFAGASVWWRRRASRAMELIPAEEKTDGSAFNRLRTNCIITWSLSESVAVMGLILGFLAHDLRAFAPYAAAALGLLTIHRPSTWPLWPARSQLEKSVAAQAN